MTPYAYERLSAQDSSFLVFEGPNTHMHIGGTTLFEVGPLRTASGGIDIDRIRQYVASRLHAIPRYRQKLHYVPIENLPCWIDDEHLNLEYHVRHTALPRPGDDAQLKALSARVMSQKLDRSKPLWELWIVEGLSGDRFAMILKTHHSVVDGVSGVDLVGALLRPTPEEKIPRAPRWEPRRLPSLAEFLREELSDAARSSIAIGNLLQSAWTAPEKIRERISDGANAAWQTLNAGLRMPAATPLNQDIGPYRRFDWTTSNLADVKEIKNRLGGAINDVVLATVAGAVRRFLQHRHARTRGIDYRVVVPVSVRPAGETDPSGNRVSAWMMSLPIGEADPLRRYDQVRATTAELKRTNQAHGIEVFAQLAEYAAPIMTLGVRLAARLEPYNMIVTNVPGPPEPLYLLGARMLAGFPNVPLFEKQGLAVALLSYDGQLNWGFHADWDLVPDLERFTAAVDESFAELLASARAAPPPGGA
jgi:WS/DGAT/MGAT family acyltransferase